MEFSFYLHPEADEDLKNAYAWYEDKQTELGERFLEAVHKRIKLIVRTPQFFGSKRRGYREVLVDRKFPHSIVYKLYPDKKVILICSIFHSKRSTRGKYRKEP